MGVSDKLLKQLESPLDKLTEYKDKELPKLQKDTGPMEKSHVILIQK